MIKYSINDVKKHNKIHDCWVIVNNKVYDVTKLIKLHPGGVNAIMKYAGTDCTKHFNFHSKKAKKIWEEYLIGYTNGYKTCIIL